MPTWCKGRCIRCVSASQSTTFLYWQLPGFPAYLGYWKWASQRSTPDSGVWNTWLSRHYHVKEKPQFKRRCKAAPSVLEGFLHLLGVQDFLWFPLSKYEGWQPSSCNSTELHANAHQGFCLCVRCICVDDHLSLCSLSFKIILTHNPHNNSTCVWGILASSPVRMCTRRNMERWLYADQCWRREHFKLRHRAISPQEPCPRPSLGINH